MAEKNKLKLNPYRDITTQEGEYAQGWGTSPDRGTNRGWKLVKDHKNPSKRVWHLTDLLTGKVYDKKIGTLTLGGELAEWAKGGMRNTQNWFANLSIQKQIEYQEMIDKGYVPTRKNKRSNKITWVKKENNESKFSNKASAIDSVSDVAESNNFNQNKEESEPVDNGISVDGQSGVPLAIEGLNSPGTKKLTTGTSPESSGILTKPKPWARQWAGGDGTTLEEANKNTVNWLKQEGYDVSSIPRHKLKDLLADVRLDRAFFTSGTKGQFLHHDGHIIKKKTKKTNEKK